MPEIRHSAEINDSLNEGPNFGLICTLLKSRSARIFTFLLMSMGIIGCASKSRLLRQENCDDYRARTYRNADGTHGFSEIVVFPTDSSEEFRCTIKPECLKLKEDEKKPDPKDCVDWSEPCEEL